jgi:hypothetical protein
MRENRTATCRLAREGARWLKKAVGRLQAILLFSCYIWSILYVIYFIYYFKYKIH